MTRDFTLKIKALSPEGAFDGICSPYGPPADMQGDLIEPGAYKNAIAQQGKGYPLLFAHRQDEPLGLARIEDAKNGLLIHGTMVMEDPNAQTLT